MTVPIIGIGIAAIVLAWNWATVRGYREGWDDARGVWKSEADRLSEEVVDLRVLLLGRPSPSSEKQRGDKT